MHKRKPRGKYASRRRKAYKEVRDRILIVCEGEETEPNYFKYLIRQLRLSSAQVLVVGEECGSAPNSIVEYAIEKIRQARDNPYDQVWCVFDVEIRKHNTLNDAYNRIEQYTPPQKSSTKLKHALTNPFFEYWYILHFEKTSRTYTAKKELFDHLKKHISNYTKGNKDIPGLIFEKLEAAISHAELVIREKHYGNDLRDCNPSTHVHLLVQYLQEVASR